MAIIDKTGELPAGFQDTIEARGERRGRRRFPAILPATRALFGDALAVYAQQQITPALRQGQLLAAAHELGTLVRALPTVTLVALQTDAAVIGPAIAKDAKARLQGR